MIFVDTNYFIRFLLKDIPAQYNEAELLFLSGAKNKKKLFTSTIVIFEIFWLFVSFYKKTKSEVVDILKNILSLQFVYIKEREVISNALGFYENSNLEFEDCYNIAYSRSEKAKDFKTFDKKLSKYLHKIEKKIPTL